MVLFPFEDSLEHFLSSLIRRRDAATPITSAAQSYMYELDVSRTAGVDAFFYVRFISSTTRTFITFLIFMLDCSASEHRPLQRGFFLTDVFFYYYLYLDH